MKSNFTLLFLISLSKLLSHRLLRFQWSRPWKMLRTSTLLLRWLQQNPLCELFSEVQDDQMYRSQWRFWNQKHEVDTNFHQIFEIIINSRIQILAEWTTFFSWLLRHLRCVLPRQVRGLNIWILIVLKCTSYKNYRIWSYRHHIIRWEKLIDVDSVRNQCVHWQILSQKSHALFHLGTLQF